VPVTPAPEERVLELLRTRIREEVAETYPRFAQRLGAGTLDT
jgi:hypothetical protein